MVGFGGCQAEDDGGRHFGVDFSPWVFLFLLRLFFNPFVNSLATLYKVALLQISEKTGISSRAERPARSWDMIRARCSVFSMVKYKQNWIFVRLAKIKVVEDWILFLMSGDLILHTHSLRFCGVFNFVSKKNLICKFCYSVKKNIRSK